MLTNSFRKAEGTEVLREALGMARRNGLSARERCRVEAALATGVQNTQAYQAWAVHFPNDFYPLHKEAAIRADRFETEATVRLYSLALAHEEYLLTSQRAWRASRWSAPGRADRSVDSRHSIPAEGRRAGVPRFG